VDLSIQCAIEGQMGKAYVDDPDRPSAWCINAGPFWYFAGDQRGPGSAAMLDDFPAFNLLMPSTPGWLEKAQEHFGQQLKAFPRYSFSAEKLRANYLERLLQSSPHLATVVPITPALAADLTGQPESYLELGDFDSLEDFVERSFGFAALAGQSLLGVAYGSLVCSQGIEVSIFVEEAHRRSGLATALAAALLLESLRRGLRPNWDAANPASVGLALKLGYEAIGSYQAYYHTG
jgi:hypothetical protein